MVGGGTSQNNVMGKECYRIPKLPISVIWEECAKNFRFSQSLTKKSKSLLGCPQKEWRTKSPRESLINEKLEAHTKPNLLYFMDHTRSCQGDFKS